jgi:glycerol-3-phosphate dehydrogenase
MSKIIRDPEGFTKKEYDLIIVGGGIYGVMLSYETSKRGLKSLLLEKADFGGATTFNCLRILHGGFRYLQTMNLHRFCESVAERKWFLRHFPTLVFPLPCLMPLYGNGLRRPALLWLASWINDVLSFKRNHGIPKDQHLPSGKIISATETKELAPVIDPRGLKGGVVWYDAYMPDSQRIVMELLRWSCKNGADALNYVEALELIKKRERVNGVKARDLESGNIYQFSSNVVVNAAGPWCREVATRFDRDVPELFKGSIAWNVLFDRPFFSSYALAVAPKIHKAQTYFLLPFKGLLLAGTGHAPWSGSLENPRPSIKMIRDFIINLNYVVPSLKVSQKEILRIFAGLLPSLENGGAKLAVRERIFRHSDHRGPIGLYSVSGVKFTTARLVAEKTLKHIFNKKILNDLPPNSDSDSTEPKLIQMEVFSHAGSHANDWNQWEKYLGAIVATESVQHLDDLIFRRTNLWEDPHKATKVVQDINFGISL